MSPAAYGYSAQPYYMKLLAMVLFMLLEPVLDLNHKCTKRFSRGVGSEFSAVFLLIEQLLPLMKAELAGIAATGYSGTAATIAATY